MSNSDLKELRLGSKISFKSKESLIKNESGMLGRPLDRIGQNKEDEMTLKLYNMMA